MITEKIFVAGLSLLLTAGSTLASTMTSVSCSTPTAPFASTSSSCNEIGKYGFADAGVTTQLTSNSSQTIVGVSSLASAALGGYRGVGAESTAQASANVDLLFDTSGPVRNGYLLVKFDQTSWLQPNFGAISQQLSIGPSYTWSASGSFCALLPILLGTQFNFDYLDSLTANGDAASGESDASAGALISLQAFELDKSTPVELSDEPLAPAPEPGSLGMIGIGCVLGLTIIIWFRR